LQEIIPRYPDITIRTFNDDFVKLVPDLLRGVPPNAFSFVLMDPKGWKIDMRAVAPLLRRPNCEVVFNFMFTMINWSASMPNSAIQAGLERLMPDTDWKRRLDELARACLAMLVDQYRRVLAHLLETDRAVCADSRATELGRRLQEVRGVGPLVASALVATVPDPQVSKSGRSLSAWLGLVPRQHSSGGKERLGGITKAGDTYLRRMLFVGAMAVIRHAERHGTRRPWLMKLLSRRHPRVAAIALANKIGRIAWALMTSGERYREPVAA